MIDIATTFTDVKSGAEHWADRICTQMGKSVESILEVGRLLQRAKDDLPHGEWGRLFEDELLPFTRNTAARLMAIGAHPLLSNSAHVHALPPSWGTLYELTKADPVRLKNALKDGVITPDMPRKAVAALLPPKREPRATAEPVIEDAAPLSRWADEDVRQIVQSALKPASDLASDWPDDRDFSIFLYELKTLLRFVERRQEIRHAALPDAAEERQR